jgi:hypothetical protein
VNRAPPPAPPHAREARGYPPRIHRAALLVGCAALRRESAPRPALHSRRDVVSSGTSPRVPGLRRVAYCVIHILSTGLDRTAANRRAGAAPCNLPSACPTLAHALLACRSACRVKSLSSSPRHATASRTRRRGRAAHRCHRVRLQDVAVSPRLTSSSSSASSSDSHLRCRHQRQTRRPLRPWLEQHQRWLAIAQLLRWHLALR